MPDYDALRAKARELADRAWDRAEMAARGQALSRQGIAAKVLNAADITAHEQEILDRVQSRGEDYCVVTHICAKASALAVMEEFGLGNMEIAKALSPFPGFAGSGWICGAVSGGFVALGLYFGSDDLLDYAANRRSMVAGREFMHRFEQEVGTVLCPEIQEVLFGKVLFGRVLFGRVLFGTDLLDPTRRQDAFSTAEGLLGCCVMPGIAARIAAQIIIESLKDSIAAS